VAEFLKLMEGWGDYQPVNGRAVKPAELAAAQNLLMNREGLPQHVWTYRLQEAITTSTFPYLFGNVIEREMIARYKACVADWKSYFKIARLRDFRTVYRHKVQGNDTRLDIVAEKGEYLVGPATECRLEYHLDKYGRQFDISWEAVINDDLGAFDDIAPRFSTAALRTEAINATKTFVDVNGPHASHFSAQGLADPCDGQVVINAGTLPLTILNLETTMELMAAQVDVNGEPLCIQGVHLVVPPALELTARQILTSTMKMWIDNALAAAAARAYPMTSVIPQLGLKLHVDPYIPVVNTGGNQATTWYLFADPSQVAAMEFGYLRGHETPEICMKASDKVSMGGGAISPFEGDFATDNIFYRVRIVKGSLFLDPRAAYAQIGTATET